MKEGRFKDLLKDWWQWLNFRGSSSFSLATKLKALKGILKTWNKEVFGKVEVNKSLALQQVNFWDTQEGSRTLSVEEVEARRRPGWNVRNGFSWRKYPGGKNLKRCGG